MTKQEITQKASSCIQKYGIFIGLFESKNWKEVSGIDIPIQFVVGRFYTYTNEKCEEENVGFETLAGFKHKDDALTFYNKTIRYIN